MIVSSPMHLLTRKLASRAVLSDEDQSAILALPYTARAYDAPAYLVREGEPPRRFCSFVVSGYAYRQKLTAQGTRQIMAIHMPGDILDLQQLFLKQSDHNVQALTRLETADIDRESLRELALARPAIGEALWVDALVDASILREWVLNVGRRDARSRIAHLLCEFAVRMEAIGLDVANGYDLPMTQEQLGDATGLTSVHVNRTLKTLVADGLMHRQGRFLTFNDWQRLRSVADFNALYLHTDQAKPLVGS
jgi:CRP-like cAMP-binding protein